MPSFRTPLGTLEFEILHEKVSALGRLGRRLEASLAALKSFDAAEGQDRAGDRAERRAALVAEAGEALWFLIVQREACGLYDGSSVMADYGVPIDVRNRMGPVRDRK